MTRKLLIKAVALIAGLVAASAVSANAGLTLTLSSGTANSGPFTDGGSGFISEGSVSINGWTFTQLVVDYNNTDNPSSPCMDIDYAVKTWGSSPLTITLTENGMVLPYANGTVELSLGGSDGSSSPTSQVTQNALLNGSPVGSIGPFGGKAYNGDNTVAVAGLSTTFSLTDELVLTGTGQTGGDATLTVAPVPEPTAIASAALLMLLPLGASAARVLRKK